MHGPPKQNVEHNKLVTIS